MDAQERRLQLAEIAGTWVAAITVVLGGVFGVFQYLEHKSAVRVDRTMGFVERYHSDGLLMDARLSITNSMNLHVDDINRLLTNSAIKPENLAKTYNDEINKIVEQDSLSGHLEQIFTFYEQIVLCRELILCDKPVAEQFFDTDAKAYIRTYYPYICAVRKQWNNPSKFARVVDFYIPNGGSICEL